MAGDFDGTDDVIDMGEITEYNGLADASWFMWMDVDNVAARHHGYGEAGADNSDTSWLIYQEDSGPISGRTDTYSVTVTDGSSGFTILDGASGAANTTGWQCSGATYDGGSATGLRLYIDGAEDANSPASVAAISTLPTVTGGVTIGEQHNAAGDHDGGLAWCCGWDAILSDAKMAALNRGANPFIIQFDNLIGCYPIANTDNLEQDISPSRNDGTVTGVTQATRGPPVEPLENFM